MKNILKNKTSIKLCSWWDPLSDSSFKRLSCFSHLILKAYLHFSWQLQLLQDSSSGQLGPLYLSFITQVRWLTWHVPMPNLPKPKGGIARMHAFPIQPPWPYIRRVYEQQYHTVDKSTIPIESKLQINIESCLMASQNICLLFCLSGSQDFHINCYLIHLTGDVIDWLWCLLHANNVHCPSPNWNWKRKEQVCPCAHIIWALITRWLSSLWSDTIWTAVCYEIRNSCL